MEGFKAFKSSLNKRMKEIIFKDMFTLIDLILLFGNICFAVTPIFLIYLCLNILGVLK